MTVLVVGAGPTGLTVAALLGQRGIACVVVERRTQQFPLPRAVHLDDESMCVLRQVGVADSLTTRPALGLRLVDAQHRTLAQFDRAAEVGPLGYPRSNMFDQPALERLLRERIASLDCVELREGVELVALDGAVASLREVSSGSVSTVCFSYLLGADGAGSTVRSLVGGGWKDLGFEERWLVVDGRQTTPLGTWDGVFQVCDPQRAATYMQVGGDHYRWEFRLHDGESADTVDLDALLRPWGVAADLEVFRRAEYTFRAGIADRWRHGNVLLLGDAAHETPPFIGQGLGLGLRDALNLSEKLAAVLEGADPALLDDYQDERARHAKALIRKAIVVGWALTGGQDRAASVRRGVLALLCRAPRLMTLLFDRTPRTYLQGMSAPVRARNDPKQYDDLADQWWDPRGDFAMLTWISQARVRHLPPGGGLLLDVACGGGLLAPFVQGWTHVGVDLSWAGLAQARDHGVAVGQADVLRLPFADSTFDVVVAGEILEHVEDLAGALAEACRVLRPGGTLVIDTIANTWWGRFSSITVAERVPAGPPKRLHDHRLFVDRKQLVALAASHGVALKLNGLRPSFVDYLLWLRGRRSSVRMLATRSTAGLFQGAGVKA